MTRTSRQPAVVNYVRKPDDDTFRLFAIDVLRVEDGAIAEITMFHGKALDARLRDALIAFTRRAVTVAPGVRRLTRRSGATLVCSATRTIELESRGRTTRG